MTGTMSVWRVYRVLTADGIYPPVIVEAFLREFDTSGAAVDFAKQHIGWQMLVREAEGKPCDCPIRRDMKGKVTARGRSEACPVHGEPR